ncbi:uncharacterized protein LOC108206849 isoform X3 [Daucus carota subsp. sativus]|uniref:uncharacterized protein LOC108206849 isoform X3 n=2 Tax=Daucus carota subsp. sativus TaxID=79200 RepID=UPI0007EF6662|nr:PREDICTED: uncharacterized protein LOC108206849 isoform X1 [Daucus carota subsp. sativus]
MSGPAFKKVLENRQEECSSGTLVTAPNRMGTLKESSEVIVRGLHQVSGGGFYNLGSEDEAVEHLLTELVPEYIDAVRNVLQFDAFGLYNCFGSGPLPLPDNRHPESAADKPNISNMLHEKATQKQKTTQLSIVKSEGNSEGHHTMSSTTNDLPDTYEDYLLDAEYLECGTDMNPVPSRGHSTENLHLDQQCKDSSLSHCNVMYEGWCTSSKLVSEANENSFSPNKMTVDERISVSSEEDMILTSASNPLTGVFNFRTKPRSRHMRRYRHTNSNYLKTFSVEDTCFSSSVPDMKEKVIVNVVRGKYKPAQQRYTSRSIAKSSRFSSRTCEYSAVSKDMIRPKKSVRQCPREGLRPRVLIHGSGKKNSEAASTGVLSGVPLEQRSMEKGNEFEDSADSVSAGSDVDFNIGLCSVESQETSSEGSFLSAAKTHKSNNSKRQRHIPWSHEEVLQLVNGVSKHGVGKWTDIKKVSFPLSPHRSAVDLKDKWRNLVRASCRFSERKKRVGKGKYWETQYLPDDILHRVKELSCIYPYPRERNFKVSQNVGFSANVSVQNCDKFMPFSMTLKV